MSRLSKLIRRYEESLAIEAVVRFLETIDIPGEDKKKLAMYILKALHVKAGGTWDKALEIAISGAIEYVLARVRREVQDWRERRTDPGPAEPPEDDAPTGGSIYGNFEDMPVADDELLLKMGYKSDDVIWTYGTAPNERYTILKSGSIPPLKDDEGNKVDDIPLRVIGR